MVVVSVVALSTEAVVAAVARAARDHAPLLRSLIDETRGAFGLTAALSTTGALIALAERPLGIVAIPLFLFPLLLTQFAVRRYATIRATYRQTIRALSRLTELGGYTEPGTRQRVAPLATWRSGATSGMSERELLDLEYAALLHDIGQVALREPIPGGATVMAAPADQRRIAHDGAEIVRRPACSTTSRTILEAPDHAVPAGARVRRGPADGEPDHQGRQRLRRPRRGRARGARRRAGDGADPPRASATSTTPGWSTP